jgi:8-oxo-dGTP pyrophosphatase MutT (NUDIX family)
MECVNCKKRGHSFRDCKEPTSSYGIAAIRYAPYGDAIEPYYLLIRRRDSLAYVDFLRGKYDMSNRAYIETLLNQMTQSELQRLLTRPFDELWTALWNAQNTRQFRLEYENAKRTFDTIRNTGDISGKTLARYIAEVTTRWDEPEWGLPKGRRSPHETEIACALREFSEETGIPTKDVRIREGQVPEVEEYMGTNGIRYRHSYYIADCETDASVNVGNRVQTREVGDIGWFTFGEAYLKIRPTNPEKRAALARIHARGVPLAPSA